ncbi:dihydropteroate synthase [Tsukamurella paurometabola DSM 20162]|uniref:Dihydropteroate synthase n=1 Tax=Tsukamurella paurometabola (strain ATCC 8368 / DSM 20162 / CCUG 35730 / CIP 100753 / JCM 10117 / KCTC 9821 / NBRC 16120 / NCIMB 702349 / NCTC 13040) TaxID=521096 RepID=D5UVY8_TSUPD|nr:dihydropteroate synthase [Tsukamurella paurometabola DSM 20162]
MRSTLCGRPVPVDRALVMAIINRTPDSFYDRGSYFAVDAALDRVDAAVAEGADIVDVGGVKAGPGQTVDAAEEIARTVPFIAQVRERHPQLLISVDTWRSSVAEAAVDAGADLINDTWAGADRDLPRVAAETGAGLVCSHTGGAVPRSRPYRVRYPDVVAEVRDHLVAAADAAYAAGVREDGIVIDPTHDFGKNTHHGLALLRHLDALVDTGWPVLMALSNKDFIGETLDAGLEERVAGTLAATALAARDGARMFRVHQVADTRRVIEMVAAIDGTRPPARVVRGLA